MRYLVDTHTFLWFVENHPSLSRAAQKEIEDEKNEIFLSVASLWEMSIKVSLGKLVLSQSFDRFVVEQLPRNDIQVLNITIDHTVRIATMPFHHRDPFDRLIISQSLTESMPILGADAAFDAYGVDRIW